jgi:hypothetical protein
VIEEHEHDAIWGARGFTHADLQSELTTLTFDKRMLEIYRSLEDESQDLPKTYQRSLNISQNVTFQAIYRGGMGGRGLIYGGDIKGKVPLLFALLEPYDEEALKKKVQELIRHGQLGKALKGLTEGESEVPTAYALRSKFKTKNWITVQVMGGSASGDILNGDIGMVIGWFANKSNELEIHLLKIENEY